MIQTRFPSDLCTAIRLVETGGHPDPANAVGAAGEIGPLQITEEAWIDAIENDPSIGGEYGHCRGLEYSQRIFVAYLDRYVEIDGPDEVLARTWNGGPYGASRASTAPYWGRVKEALDLVRDSQMDRESRGKGDQQGEVSAGRRESITEATKGFERRSACSGLDD